MFSDAILARARSVLAEAQKAGFHLITAESCTGGLIAAALTEIPGSSAVVLGGFVTYANEAKMELLRVSGKLLTTHGAVSEEVARAMSEGAILAARHIVQESASVLAISATGIAGPGGGSAEKPVGTVHLAVSFYPSNLNKKLGCAAPSPYPSPACGRGKLPLRVSESAAGEGGITTTHQECHFSGSRQNIRAATVLKALEMMEEALRHPTTVNQIQTFVL
jgi:nicotinamide-nucleotide amidase